MAITINTTTIQGIDSEYPVAGVDNDSQGFRDNFTAIKNSLSAAAVDLSVLDNESAKITQGNNFGGNTISNAKLSGVSEHYFNGGTISQANQEVRFTNGHYQRFGIQSNSENATTINFELLGFPTEDDKLSKLTIELIKIGTGVNPIVNFSSGVSGQIRTNGTLELPITLGSESFPTIVEFWTHDGGIIIYGQSLGQFNAV